jgi:hypothetical protein
MPVKLLTLNIDINRNNAILSASPRATFKVKVFVIVFFKYTRQFNRKREFCILDFKQFVEAADTVPDADVLSNVETEILHFNEQSQI